MGFHPAPERFKDRDKKVHLKKLEDIISDRISAVYEVAAALKEISESKLYRLEFKTFDDYCKAKWGFGKDKARRLIAGEKNSGQNKSQESANASSTDKGGSKSSGSAESENGQVDEDSQTDENEQTDEAGDTESRAGSSDTQSKCPRISDRLKVLFDQQQTFKKMSGKFQSLISFAKTLEATEAYAIAHNGKPRKEWSAFAQEGVDYYKSITPEVFCPNCKGAEASQDNNDGKDNCKKCNGKGYLTVEEVEESK